MAFNTWSDVLTALKTRIADGDITVGSITMANGKSITWQSVNQFWIHFNEVERRAQGEATAFSPRTYAKDGGRG